jgi:hypothetical protein
MSTNIQTQAPQVDPTLTRQFAVVGDNHAVLREKLKSTIAWLLGGHVTYYLAQAKDSDVDSILETIEASGFKVEKTRLHRLNFKFILPDDEWSDYAGFQFVSRIKKLMNEARRRPVDPPGTKAAPQQIHPLLGVDIQR